MRFSSFVWLFEVSCRFSRATLRSLSEEAKTNNHVSSSRLLLASKKANPIQKVLLGVLVRVNNADVVCCLMNFQLRNRISFGCRGHLVNFSTHSHSRSHSAREQISFHQQRRNPVNQSRRLSPPFLRLFFPTFHISANLGFRQRFKTRKLRGGEVDVCVV